MKKKYLFIVDPQNDFIEGGSLPVTGGTKALQEIVDSGILDKEWEKIYVTLDTHYPQNLGFGEPKTKLLQKLYKNIHVTPWPSHCIKDTHGWEIYEPLMKKLEGRENVEYLIKGEEDDKEAYSAFNFSDGGRIEYNLKKLECINLIEDLEIYYTGLAEDYCVLETIRSIMKYQRYAPTGLFEGIKEWKHVLLQDMTAPINSREVVDELYMRLPKIVIRK